jgi:hypothetical protein
MYGTQKMNQQLLNELLALKERDIQMRSRLLREGKLYRGYDPQMQQVHRENAVELDKIVCKHGWPAISLVGLDGSRAAWFVAQHSICTPALQRKFLVLLSKASESGDVPEAQVAFLTDRVRFNENKPQVYGTVLDWNENAELSCDVEDPANLDARRKDAGLPPFQQDIEKYRREVESDGGKPPADFVQYKNEVKEWAQNVGWL